LVSHKQQAGYADLSELVDGEKKENRVGVKRKLADPIKPRKVYQNPRALMYLKATAQSFLESCFNGKKKEKENSICISVLIIITKYSILFFCIKRYEARG
jgi:hypothetical protein